jgi:hypothetical protein
MVEALRDEASLAVHLYDDAADVWSFEGFVIHCALLGSTSSSRVHP